MYIDLLQIQRFSFLKFLSSGINQVFDNINPIVIANRKYIFFSKYFLLKIPSQIDFISMDNQSLTWRTDNTSIQPDFQPNIEKAILLQHTPSYSRINPMVRVLPQKKTRNEKLLAPRDVVFPITNRSHIIRERPVWMTGNTKNRAPGSSYFCHIWWPSSVENLNEDPSITGWSAGW